MQRRSVIAVGAVMAAGLGLGVLAVPSVSGWLWPSNAPILGDESRLTPLDQRPVALALEPQAPRSVAKQDGSGQIDERYLPWHQRPSVLAAAGAPEAAIAAARATPRTPQHPAGRGTDPSAGAAPTTGTAVPGWPEWAGDDAFTGPHTLGDVDKRRSSLLITRPNQRFGVLLTPDNGGLALEFANLSDAGYEVTIPDGYRDALLVDGAPGPASGSLVLQTGVVVNAADTVPVRVHPLGEAPQVDQPQSVQ